MQFLSSLNCSYNFAIFDAPERRFFQTARNDRLDIVGCLFDTGLWSNTCCSHPMPGETTEAAARRRLQEEMGMQCELIKPFSFIYKAHLDHGLTEFEFDHVFTGHSDAEPVPNSEEVAAWKYINVTDLQTDIRNNPENYTEWFKICIKNHIDALIR